jgi:hypothetical protein
MFGILLAILSQSNYVPCTNYRKMLLYFSLILHRSSPLAQLRQLRHHRVSFVVVEEETVAIKRAVQSILVMLHHQVVLSMIFPV